MIPELLHRNLLLSNYNILKELITNLSVLVNTMTERDFGLLFQSINDVLKNNSRVTMIILTAELAGSDDNGWYRYDRLRPFENEHPKHRLPDYYSIGRST